MLDALNSAHIGRGPSPLYGVAISPPAQELPSERWHSVYVPLDGATTAEYSAFAVVTTRTSTARQRERGGFIIFEDAHVLGVWGVSCASDHGGILVNAVAMPLYVESSEACEFVLEAPTPSIWS